jgi:hypothetical protein
MMEREAWVEGLLVAEYVSMGRDETGQERSGDGVRGSSGRGGVETVEVGGWREVEVS